MIARRLLLVGPALLSVAGCGGPPAPAVVELSIKASPDLNPNPAGTPVSVAVRLYSLMGRGRFMSADAYALMDREKATLGDESAGSEEIVLRPGEIRDLSRWRPSPACDTSASPCCFAKSTVLNGEP